MGEEKGEAAFWFVVGMGGFFVLTFLILALSLRKNFSSWSGMSHDARGFYSLGLLRFTSLKFVQKQPEKIWQKIRELKIPTEELVKPHPHLESLKRKFRKAGLSGLLGFTFMVISILLLSSLKIFLAGFGHSLFNTIFGLFYLLILVGFTGQLFLSCLLGFLNKDLIVWGHWGGGRYSGLMARYFSILGMLLAIFLLGVGLLPVYFIAQVG